MQWFGKSWHAPVCTICQQTDTPTGKLCLACKKPIAFTDRGFITPYMGEAELAEAVFHRDCFLKEIFGEWPRNLLKEN